MKKGNPCDGCVHFYADYEVNLMCNYIFDTGKRRPCPFGAGCTVKKLQKRKRKTRRKG